ncbi:MAG: GNAT family protein [Eubacteriales bacterium]|nr:GNAT family protein [Eubacteriales bacterium]
MRLADYIEHKPVLTTKRLTLRTMTAEDADDLKEWTPDKSLYAYWGKSPGKADKDPALLFASPQKPTKSFHWGVVYKAEDKVIGEAWVYLIENDRMAKVALRFSKKYHGQGFAAEALKRIVRFCFEETELQRLWTDVDVRNTASVRLLERCGFTREGLIRQGKMVSTWCDYYLYGLLKTDEAAKGQPPA